MFTNDKGDENIRSIKKKCKKIPISYKKITKKINTSYISSRVVRFMFNH